MTGQVHTPRGSGRARRVISALAVFAVTTAGLAAIPTTDAGAAPGTFGIVSTSRVDVTSTGDQLETGSCIGYYGGCGGSLSADGQQTAFVTSEPATPSDGNGNWDVFVHDASSDAVSLQSLAADGGPAAFAYESSISGTGRYVAFSGCCSLVPGEADSSSQVYVRDRDTDGNGIFDEPGTTTTVLVSKVATVGTPAAAVGTDGGVLGPHISSNGRFVTFLAFGNVLPGGNPSYYLGYLHDRDPDGNGIFDEPGQETTELAAVDSAGNPVGDLGYYSCGWYYYSASGCSLAVSDDGASVAFTTTQAIDPGDLNGSLDLYIHRRDRGDTKLMSTDPAGAPLVYSSAFGSMSANGRYAVFIGYDGSLPGYNGYEQLYRVDRDADGNGVLDEPGGTTLDIVSTSETGESANSHIYDGSVSNDGTVAFTSPATNLDPTYPNPSNRPNAYVRLPDGQVALASASADTTSAGYAAYGATIAADATVVTFTSDYPDLVPNDTNNNWDTFRVEMGNTASGVTASLDAPATVLPGATSVAINDIPTETRKAFDLDVSTSGSAAHLRGSAVHLRGSAVHLRGSAAHLRGSAVHLRGSAVHLRDEPVESIATRLGQSNVARDAPLSQIKVTTDGGWPALLAGTQYADTPIQSVTTGDLLDLLAAGPASGSPLASLRLGDLDLTDSPLAAITPAAFELGTTPVRALYARNGQAWCDAFLGETGTTCEAIGVPADSSRSLMELDLDADAALLLAEHADLRRPPIGPNLAALEAGGAPVLNARLDDMNLGVTHLGDLDLASVIEASPAVAAIPLSTLGTGDLRDASIACDAGFDCSQPGATLGDALAAGVVRPGRTLAGIGGGLGTVTIGGLGADLLRSIDVNDVVTGFLDAADFPWEDLDLVTAGVQDYSDDAHPIWETLNFRVASTSNGLMSADVQMNLPAGFRFDPQVRSAVGSIDLWAGGEGGTATLVSKVYGDSSTTLRFHVTGVFPNADAHLRVRVLPSLRVGPGQVSARIWAGGRSRIAAPVGQSVVESPDPGAVPASAQTIGSDRLYFGYLGAGSDVDLFHFSPLTKQSEVGVRLTHLAGDADLVLYGPPTDTSAAGPSSAPTRSIAPQIAPIDDEGLDPTGNQVAALPETNADVPVTPPTAGDVVVGKSATSDAVDEEIASGAGADYIQVSSYNGASTTMPYVLHVHEVAPAHVPACQAYTHPYTGSAGTLPDLTALPADLQSVFLVNEARLYDKYPAADVTAFLARLQTLASDPSVKGVILPVEGSNPNLPGLAGYPDIAGAFTDLNAKTCDPDLANRVVDRITTLVRSIRSGSLPGVSAHHALANVVVVGSDSIIPMARATDTTRSGNESQYADAFDPGSPIGAALASDHFLTDAPFGDLDPIPWLNRRLYVEDLAVGRLVETPQQMTAMVDAYLAPTNAGSLDPTRAYVAGYDWMKPGASSVSSTLASRLTVANDGHTVTPGTLITDDWSTANLLSGAGSIGATHPTITGLYMHADHTQGISADGSTFAPSELAAALPTGSKLVFSMGCHSGLTDPTRTDTFPGQMNGSGAAYLASTGFGYGDASGVQLHDRLVNAFADQLDGSMTIGAALTRAKQAYFSTEGVYGQYDDKVLESMTLYGLPMFRVGTTGAATAAPPDVTPTAGTGGVSSATFAYDTTNPGAVDVPMQGALVAHTDPRGSGSWYEVNGYLPLALPGRPVQPRVDHDVTARTGADLLPAHGALITDLGESAQPIAHFDASWSRATIDASATSPEFVAGEVAFPARLASITSYSDPSGATLDPSGPPQRQRLVVTPGRFESSGERDATGTGTQDLFSRVEGRVLYSASNDYTEPAIHDSSGVVDPIAHTTTFTVDASDASGVTRALVLYRDDNGWHHFDLAPDTGSAWSGITSVFSSASAVPYFVEVVDAHGNVGVASNKGALFQAAVHPAIGITDVSVNEPTSGTAPVTFTVALSKATTVPVQVDWTTADATASSLGDYTAGSGSLLFEPGETSKQITLDVRADTEDEPNETFTVQLSNPVNSTIDNPTGTATIVSPDAIIDKGISISDATVSEGDAKPGTLNFVVTLPAPATSTVTVTVASQDGTATGGAKPTTPGADYKILAPKVLTFLPKQFAKSVSVSVVPDTATEGDETMNLVLSNASGASIARRVGTGTIVNDDPASGNPMTASGATVVEGDAKTRTANVVVRFASAVTADTTLTYTTVDGTATGGAKPTTPGADYQIRARTLLLRSGQAVAKIPISIIGDNVHEGRERFTVQVTGPGGTVSATVTILDDE